MLRHLNTADLDEGQSVEGQEVTRRGAHKDMSVIVGPIRQAAYQATRLEGSNHRGILLNTIKDHQERLKAI